MVSKQFPVVCLSLLAPMQLETLPSTTLSVHCFRNADIQLSFKSAVVFHQQYTYDIFKLSSCNSVVLRSTGDSGQYDNCYSLWLGPMNSQN